MVWSYDWKIGFSGSHRVEHWGEEADSIITVSEGGTVETPAGTFDDCLLVKVDSGIAAFNKYMLGTKKYYFAPGVGIVKFVTHYGDEPISFVLTDYDGTGDGFFPVADGLWRRMECSEIREDCRTFIEVRFAVDGETAVMIVDQCADQDSNSPTPIKFAQ